MLESEGQLTIKRSHFIEKEFNNIKFLYSKIEYPLLIHKFDNFEILTEIVIKERQFAFGVQPMLYLCFPVTMLENSEKLIGRKALPNEKAEFVLNRSNYGIILQLLKLFGMLSIGHRKDITSIIELCLDNL